MALEAISAEGAAEVGSGVVVAQAPSIRENSIIKKVFFIFFSSG